MTNERRVSASGMALVLTLWIGLGCQGPSPDEPEAAQSPPPIDAAVAAGGFCGGIAGLRCAPDLWCDPEPGACGEGADRGGTCVATAPMCTRDYRPVCGCDGQTYGNDCSRRAVRVAKAHEGECPDEGSSRP